MAFLALSVPDSVAHCNVCSMIVRDGSSPGARGGVAGGPRRPRAGAAAAPSARSPRRRRAGRSGRAAGARVVADGRPARRGCSTPSWPAATSTTPPAGCGPRAAASTRSARPATRPTRSSPPPCARPTRRCCTTARAASTWPGPSRSTGHDGVARRAARPAGVGRRTDRRRPPQGVRPRRAGRHPADVDDRLAPAAGDGRGVRHRPGPPPRRADAVAGRRARRGHVRRRLAEPLDGPGRDQRRRLHRPPGRARCRCCSCARTTGWGISVPTPAGWVEASLSGAARAALRAGREHRSGRRVRRRRGPRRARAGVGSAGRAAPAHRALRRPRRHRRRVGVPHGGGDPGRAARSTRCWPRRGVLVDAGRRRRTTLVARYLAGRAAVRARAGELAERPPLRTRAEVVGAAVAAPSGGGRRPRRRRRPPERARPRSSAGCPRTRRR